MGTRYRDHDEIKAGALERLREIADHLSGGTARLVGGSWRFGKRGVYSLHRDGAAAGFNGEFQGDVIDAVAHFCTGGNRLSAFDYLRKHFGLGAGGAVRACDLSQQHQLNSTRARNAALEQARRAIALERKRGRAWQVWSNAIPIAGTPAELYLRSRAIRCPPGGWPACMRFCPTYPIDRGAPALLFAIQGESDRFMGIQSVALTREGQKNPDWNGTVKKTWPSVKGGTIRFGEPTDALFMTEGPEDALSIRQLIGCSAWACAGIAMMKDIWLPPVARTAVIMAHADAAGAAGAERARAAFLDRGLVCSIVRPPSGQDWNDLLQAGMGAAELRWWVDRALEQDALL
jgi:hypothetical protein